VHLSASTRGWRVAETEDREGDQRLGAHLPLVGDGSAPVFKWSARIALDMQMAKWRLEFKDTDLGNRLSRMPALLLQSLHHIAKEGYVFLQ